MSVNRTELIAAIAEKAGLTKTDADALLPGAFRMSSLRTSPRVRP